MEHSEKRSDLINGRNQTRKSETDRIVFFTSAGAFQTEPRQVYSFTPCLKQEDSSQRLHTAGRHLFPQRQQIRLFLHRR